MASQIVVLQKSGAEKEREKLKFNSKLNRTL